MSVFTHKQVPQSFKVCITVYVVIIVFSRRTGILGHFGATLVELHAVRYYIKEGNGFSVEIF